MSGLSVFAWNVALQNFGPQILTNRLLPLIHARLPFNLPIHVPWLSEPAPPVGSHKWLTQYRSFYLLVTGCISIYALVPSEIWPWSGPPDPASKNYYNVLGVSVDADAGELKAAFRAWAKKNHPDRGGASAEAVFRLGREGYEVLMDDTKRYAYRRFGKDVIGCTSCSTMSEYMQDGLTRGIGFHLFSVFWLFVASYLFGGNPLQFWNWMLYLTTFVLELHLVLAGQVPLLLRLILPNRLPFEYVKFLHQVCVLGNSAISKFGNAFFAYDEPDKLKPRDVDLLEEIVKLSQRSELEASMMLNTVLRSAHPIGRTDLPEAFDTFRLLNAESGLEVDDEVIERLAVEMEDMIIEHKLRAEARNGPLRSAWLAAVQRVRAQERPEQAPDPLSAEGTLPSPVSPRATPEPESSPAKSQVGELPSPRPSPPPAFPGLGLRRGSSMVRARSVSCPDSLS